MFQFCSAQSISRPSGGRLPNQSATSSVAGKAKPLQIKIYHANQPERLYDYPDTTLADNFQQPDPVRDRTIDYVHLGSLGTPARPLLFQVYERQGLDIGLHQFDLYRRTVDKIRYFDINQTFTDASYGQEHSKQDFIFGVTFARKLKNNWSLALDFDRISHGGIYNHQKSRHSAFVINFAYRPKKRYSAFLSFSYNDFRQEDNGGIQSAADFNSSLYSDRNNIPVFSTTANTRQEDNIYAITQYYKLAQFSKDSTATNARKLQLGHELVYTPMKNKFYDASPDSLFYQDLLVHNKLRHFVRAHDVQNTFKISMVKPDSIGQIKDELNVGLIHKYQFVQQEPTDTSLHNVMLFGDWSFKVADYLNWNVYARYNIGKNANEYLVKGNVALDLGKIGQLHAKVMHQRFSPSLLQTRAFVSTFSLYDKSFKKPFTTSFEANYHVPISNTIIGVGYHLLNHHIYFDNKGLPQQSSSGISVLQGTIQQNFKLGKWHLDNTLVVQTDNSDILRLPTLFSKNSLYWQGFMFKRNMWSRIGIDFMMNTNYFADAYQPLTGQFHNQNTTEIEFYPSVDIFWSAKVKSFRGFAKYENVMGWILNKPYYQTPNMPLADPHFVFGVSWMFID